MPWLPTEADVDEILALHPQPLMALVAGEPPAAVVQAREVCTLFEAKRERDDALATRPGREADAREAWKVEHGARQLRIPLRTSEMRVPAI